MGDRTGMQVREVEEEGSEQDGGGMEEGEE